MRKLLSFVLVSLLGSPGVVGAGTIVGTVRAQGKEGADEAASGGKYDSRKFKFVERVNYAQFRDFVVYVDMPMARTNAFTNHTVQVITRRIAQKGAVFLPHVLPVMVGSTVEWPNEDDIFHNVFSVSDTKPFDLGLYKHPEVKRVTFDKPGRVDIFCSIHAAMNCIILVLENPWFASADDKGRFTIRDVPPGVYKLKAWHERLPPQMKEIKVPETGEVVADFTLGITNLPKY